MQLEFAALRRAVAAAAAAAAAALLQAACTTPAVLPEPPVGAGAGAQRAAGLPPGPGRDILATSCTSCHDLGGLEPFRGYYDTARWRRLVDTMIAHGAKLDETEIAVLVDYLVEHFGPGTDRP